MLFALAARCEASVALVQPVLCLPGKFAHPRTTMPLTQLQAGEGTGLGLSISWDIVTQQHGGTIEVDSREGEFTEFVIRLPKTFGARAGAGFMSLGCPAPS
jgi:hypothetical protein